MLLFQKVLGRRLVRHLRVMMAMVPQLRCLEHLQLQEIVFFAITVSSDVDHVKANTNALPLVTLQFCSDCPSVRHQSSSRL